MHYSIDHIQEAGFDLVLLKDKHSGTEVALLPGYGALVHAYRIKTSEGLFNVIDHYDSLDKLQKELPRSFKGSKLSPFPCRLPEGKYSFDGKHYEFGNKFLDGSAIHGLLYDKPFKVIHETAGKDSVTVTMEHRYRQDDPQYPFDYTCQVVYTLFADALLQIQTILVNEGRSVMPVADGWHPYFRIGGKVDEWMLHFNAKAMVEFDQRLVPTGKLLDYDLFNLPAKIGKTELDNCFLLNMEKGFPACELFNPNNKLKISFYPDNSYPYLQIFTPPHRESIAIENLSSAPDSFNNKMGLTLLQPAAPQTFTVQYQLSLQ